MEHKKKKKKKKKWGPSANESTQLSTAATTYWHPMYQYMWKPSVTARPAREARAQNSMNGASSGRNRAKAPGMALSRKKGQKN
jgi:hypothetical protein